MNDIVREICIAPKGDRGEVSYVEISIADGLANQIFGSRVFDPYKKQWIEDDHRVIWARMIGPAEAQVLSACIRLPAGFEFDHDRFEYTFMTSTD